MSVRALTLNEIPEIASVEVARLGPEDVVVVHVSEYLPESEWQSINNALRMAFPHNRSMLIPAYAKLSVVRSGGT